MAYILLVGIHPGFGVARDCVAAAGHTVNTVSEFDTSRGDDVSPELIILPVFQPAEPGLKRLRRVRLAYPWTPILAFAGGDVTPAQEKLAQASGATRLIPGPFFNLTILSAVCTLLAPPCPSTRAPIPSADHAPKDTALRGV